MGFTYDLDGVGLKWVVRDLSGAEEDEMVSHLEVILAATTTGNEWLEEVSREATRRTLADPHGEEPLTVAWCKMAHHLVDQAIAGQRVDELEAWLKERSKPDKA